MSDPDMYTGRSEDGQSICYVREVGTRKQKDLVFNLDASGLGPQQFKLPYDAAQAIFRALREWDEKRG